MILYSGGTALVPDVTGWSKADIMKLGKILGVEVTFHGDGYCTEQSLAPYEKISDETLSFHLKRIIGEKRAHGFDTNINSHCGSSCAMTIATMPLFIGYFQMKNKAKPFVRKDLNGIM